MKVVAPVSPNAVVARPELSESVIKRLLAEGDKTVALYGLTGTGGFGKTTLAWLVAHDERIIERFSDGIAWLTLGEQLAGGDLVAKINDLATRISGIPAALSDLEQASQHLGAVSAKMHCLWIIDDVWRDSQLAPFIQNVAAPSRLLVTTRHHHVLGNAERVRVDEMSDVQALALISEGFSGTDQDRAVWQPLLKLTGRWPVLLSLANRAVHEAVVDGEPVTNAVNWFAKLLAVRTTALDLDIEDDRRLAVSQTVNASLSTASTKNAHVRDRFLELAIFPEDTAIPQATLEIYWNATACLDKVDVEWVCRDLRNRCLVQGRETSGQRRLWLHDVIVTYLQTSVDEHRHCDRLTRCHQTFLEAYRNKIPKIDGVSAWWELPNDEPYLWRHLAYHLRGAGLDAELNMIVCDIRWILAVLQRYGPVEIETDLGYANNAQVDYLRVAIERNASLLSVTKDSNALTSTLLASFSPYPELADYIAISTKYLNPPYLLPTPPRPNPPHPALRRIFKSLNGPVDALAISPTGTWLAASSDRTVLVCNTDSSYYTIRTDHTAAITDIAISPNGKWLATTSGDRTVRIWDTDGTHLTTITGHDCGVRAIAISADGNWFAITGRNSFAASGHMSSVQLWNTDGTYRRAITSHYRGMNEVAISPKDTWLAATSDDNAVELWNADGTHLSTLAGSTGVGMGIAISADDKRLATTGQANTVQVWNSDGGNQRTIQTRHTTAITDVAISPDATWIATTSDDNSVELWNTDGTHRSTLSGHYRGVSAVAISPDGNWLATASKDGTVRMWSTELSRDTNPVSPRGHGVRAVVISPDGGWFATTDEENTVELWDTEGRNRASFTVLARDVRVVAISPDGTWLATTSNSSSDESVRLWDADGTHRVTLTGHDRGVRAVAISPDSTWLATTGAGKTVQLWDAHGTYLATLASHIGVGRYVTISQDDTWIATSDARNTVQLWNIHGAHRTIQTRHTAAITDVAISPDGTWIAITSEDHSVSVWHAATCTEMGSVEMDLSVRTVTWIPDSSGFIAGTGTDLCGFRVIV